MINLTMRDICLAGRAAYDAGQLQPQVSPERIGCWYSGPCVIGSAIPEDQRDRLDEDPDAESTDIRTLCNIGLVKLPAEQLEDAVRLQSAHDNWAGAACSSERERERVFVATLEEMEAKYVTG